MKISERVENILRASHASRNSDLELWLIYAEKSGMELTDKQKSVLRDMPSFETITRVRRKLQEQGKYPADKEVEEARYNKFKNVRENINIEDPEKLFEAQGYRVIHEDWEEEYNKL